MPARSAPPRAPVNPGGCWFRVHSKRAGRAGADSAGRRSGRDTAMCRRKVRPPRADGEFQACASKSQTAWPRTESRAARRETPGRRLPVILPCLRFQRSFESRRPDRNRHDSIPESALRRADGGSGNADRCGSDGRTAIGSFPLATRKAPNKDAAPGSERKSTRIKEAAPDTRHRTFGVTHGRDRSLPIHQKNVSAARSRERNQFLLNARIELELRRLDLRWAVIRQSKLYFVAEIVNRYRQFYSSRGRLPRQTLSHASPQHRRHSAFADDGLRETAAGRLRDQKDRVIQVALSAAVR